MSERPDPKVREGEEAEWLRRWYADPPGLSLDLGPIPDNPILPEPPEESGAGN